MSDKLQQYSATDKEIYDLLMSGKQRLTEDVLRDIAKKRGIIYSINDTRDTLVDNISRLTFDYKGLLSLISKREHAGRNESTTTLTLDATLTIDQIKKAVISCQNTVDNVEKMVFEKNAVDNVGNINLDYVEINYSKTALIQKQHKKANLSVSVENGKTIIHLPANKICRKVVESIKYELEKSSSGSIPLEEIKISSLTTPEKKTSFFTSLMTSIEGYEYQTVTNLRVASSSVESSLLDDEDEDEDTYIESVSNQLLSEVKNIAMTGNNLVASNVYQELCRKGFFITSITWQSKDQLPPNDFIQFHAEFEQPNQGTGFKYSVRIKSMSERTKEYTKRFKQIDDIKEKEKLFNLIEKSAREVLKSLIDNN